VQPVSLSTDQRRYLRMPVELPATLTGAGLGQSSARLLNIAAGGALVSVLGPTPPTGSVLLIRCGTIETRAAVIWSRQGYIGIEFEQPLTEREVTDQMRRSQAILDRRQRPLAASSHVRAPLLRATASQCAPSLTDHGS
jgi:hypothetical protein